MLKMNENNFLLLLNLDKKIQILQDIVLGICESNKHTRSSSGNLNEEKKEKSVRFQIEDSQSLLNLHVSNKDTSTSEDGSFLKNRRYKSARKSN